MKLISYKGIRRILEINNIKYNFVLEHKTIVVLLFKDISFYSTIEEISSSLVKTYPIEIMRAKAVKKLFDYVINNKLITFEIENYKTYDI